MRRFLLAVIVVAIRGKRCRIPTRLGLAHGNTQFPSHLSLPWTSAIFTFAMFTLVVFTLVVGATITGAFTSAFNDVKAYGGGFDVRATTAPANPITNMQAALRNAVGVNAADFRRVSSQSLCT